VTATCDFQPIAIGGSANVDSQANFLASTYLTNGFTTGTASSASANKIWRQASFVSASLAQFICNSLNQNVLDNGDQAGFLTQMGSCIPTKTGANTWAAAQTFQGAVSATDGLTVSGTRVQALALGNLGQFEFPFGSGSQFYNAGWRCDGASVYLLSSNVQTTLAAAQTAPYNNFRPFSYTLSNGAVSIDGTGAGVTIGAAGGTVTVNSKINANGGITGNVTGNVTGSSGSCTGNSNTATNATNANYATSAGHASSADSATNANYASSAGSASSANYATSAGSANSVPNGTITAAMMAGGAAQQNLGFEPLNPGNNLSDLQSIATALQHLGFAINDGSGAIQGSAEIPMPSGSPLVVNWGTYTAVGSNSDTITVNFTTPYNSWCLGFASGGGGGPASVKWTSLQQIVCHNNSGQQNVNYIAIGR
jgi:hypothetical protein